MRTEFLQATTPLRLLIDKQARCLDVRLERSDPAPVSCGSIDGRPDHEPIGQEEADARKGAEPEKSLSQL